MPSYTLVLVSLLPLLGHTLASSAAKRAPWAIGDPPSGEAPVKIVVPPPTAVGGSVKVVGPAPPLAGPPPPNGAGPGSLAKFLNVKPVRCPFSDHACECAEANLKSGTNDMDIFCGYADKAWHFKGEEPPPPLAARADVPLPLPTINSSLPATNGSLAAAFGSILGAFRPQPPPLVERMESPLSAAIGALGGSANLVAGAENVVLNRVPFDNAATRVQGLAGTLKAPATYKGVTFDVGSSFAIRFDFAWWQGPNRLPVTGILGPYVNVLLQQADKRMQLALYFPEGTPFYTVPQMGDFYFETVLSPLAKTTQFGGMEAGFKNVNDPAKLLAEEWARKDDALNKVHH